MRSVAPRRRDRGEPTPTRYNPSKANKRNKKFSHHPVSAHIRVTPAYPVSATPTHMLRICVNPRHALSAGVQTMRARICSAFSCDMFARVVWLRLRGVTKLPIFTLSFAAHTYHAWLVRLTRARAASGSEGGRRESSLLTFAALFVSEKRDKRKVALC